MPNQYVNKVVKSDGTTLLDLSQDTVTLASHIMAGYVGHLASGEQVLGEGQSGPSATAHTIYFEFSDGTDASIVAYYNDSFISNIITSTKPSTYNNKTVTLAQLDGVTWHEPANIPIGVELVDYTKVTNNTGIDNNGDAFEQEWCYASDYIAVDPSMTFTYTAYYWFYIGVYDDSYNTIKTIYAMTDATQDSDNGNIGHGTLSGNKLTGASYVRICGPSTDSESMSLIRIA